MTHQEHYIQTLSNSLSQNTFVKISLANYKGSTEGLKNCYVKKIKIKQDDKLSFTYRYQTKDIVKNYSIEEGILIIHGFINQGAFRLATLMTIEGDLIFEYVDANKTSLKKIKATHNELPSLDHNTQKNRLISTDGKAYLHQLNITDEKGNVNKNAQDKYKQINHYIELLSPLLKNLPSYKSLNVADMGAGKGYLTFALYDYLINTLKIDAQITGVEFRKDLVELCNNIAQKSNFKKLNFVEGSISNYDADQTNVLIALHACDTATDDAIFKGILSKSDLIVVAPCCHKQIRREIEKHKIKNNLDFLLKHGIFLERQAEMVTDGLRASILEYCGYTTKIFQFISDAHTPKNIMIVAEKKEKSDVQKQEILKKIQETKTYFGIEFHYLEKLLNI